MLSQRPENGFLPRSGILMLSHLFEFKYSYKLGKGRSSAHFSTEVNRISNPSSSVIYQSNARSHLPPAQNTSSSFQLYLVWVCRNRPQAVIFQGYSLVCTSRLFPADTVTTWIRVRFIRMAERECDKILVSRCLLHTFTVMVGSNCNLPEPKPRNRERQPPSK